MRALKALFGLSLCTAVFYILLTLFVWSLDNQLDPAPSPGVEKTEIIRNLTKKGP